MDSRSNELEQFKTTIDIRIVAAELGYTVNHKCSCRSSTRLDHPDDDRIRVALGHDGHYVYSSVRDPGDSGSEIDYWQRRHGGSLGNIRKDLRPPVEGIPSMQDNEIADQLAAIVDDIYALAFCLNLVIEQLRDRGEY